MLDGALAALEVRPTGRPRMALCAESEAVRMLRERVAELEGEMRLLRTRLSIAEGPAAHAVRLRVTHLLAMKRGRRR